MKKNRLVLPATVELIGLALGALCVLGCLLVFRLGSLTRGRLSASEAVTHHDDLSLSVVLHNPINAPYKLLDFLFLRLGLHRAAYARLASVALALVAALLFFVIMYRWHGRRSAILTTILFGTSSWLLHIGRLGNGDSALLLIPLALILFASWLNTTERHGAALLYMTLASSLALLTPGAVWFLAATYLLIWKSITTHITESKLWEKSLSIVTLLCLAALLAHTIVTAPNLYKAWLNLPGHWPTPLTTLRQWIDAFAYLFVRGPSDHVRWLAHVPILDIFTSVMCLLGGYFYAAHYKNLRTHVLAVFLALGSILVAFNGAGSMSFVVPIAYLLAGTGLTFFLRRWLTVFPRNPLARGLGLGLIALVVVMTAFYHTRTYFVAWRYSPATTAAFRNQP